VTTISLEEERGLLQLARAVTGQHVLLNPGDRHRADDVLSDACAGVAEALSRWDPTAGSLNGWAYRRAAGAVIDGQRARSPLSRGAYAQPGGPERARALTPSSLEELAGSGWAPPTEDHGLHALEDRELVQQLLQLVTPLERYVLITCVAHGYSQTEVAAHMGVTVAAVNQWKMRGLQRIRSGRAARRSAPSITPVPDTLPPTPRPVTP